MSGVHLQPCPFQVISANIMHNCMGFLPLPWRSARGGGLGDSQHCSVVLGVLLVSTGVYMFCFLMCTVRVTVLTGKGEVK